MFTVVVEHRKRRIWSARTVAISVGAHALVLAGVVVAAANTAPPAPPVVEMDIGRVPEHKPQPPRPTPPRPADQPPPVHGRTLVLPTPTTVPTTILPPHDETPVSSTEYSGEGPIGTVIGPPDPGPQQPLPANPGPLHDYRTDVIPVEDAEVLPQLTNPRDAQRLLERNYPPVLRDAGVTGHTTVVLVIDRDGRVEPGSVTVRETTHEAFRDAAIRAAERFRFRPAKVQGQPVAVVISIPIEWQIAP